MLAGTSDILVILRVCVGERKMARVSQNSSGGGRVICSYVGTLNFFSGASILASVASQRAARGGCLLLHAAPWSGALTGILLLVAPPEPAGQEGRQVFLLQQVSLCQVQR